MKLIMHLSGGNCLRLLPNQVVSKEPTKKAMILMVVAVAILSAPVGSVPEEADFSEKSKLAPHEISYLILSQSSAFHYERANDLRRSILEQQLNINNQLPTGGENVHLSHEIFADHEGSWAITPILKHIRASILKASHAGTRWLIICEQDSHVNVSLLAHHLGKEDYRQELFLGYPLHDREATIIHHFAFFKNPSSFLYPYLRAGIALTVPLVDGLVRALSSAGQTLTEFFIDAAHEFALLAWNRGTGNRLTSASYFCARRANGCAIYAKQLPTMLPAEETCNHPPVAGRERAEVTSTPILFAVKTCEKFHAQRVPVLLHTWARYVHHLRLYSDIFDASIPTIATSIPNTSIGHCGKSLEILQLVQEEMFRNRTLVDVRWIMLVDDDTILSPSALTRFLSGFDSAQDVYIGERYGYHLLAEDGQGYNYVTGGGGIVISVRILGALLRSCECPSASSPDDMIIAACLYRLGVRPIHSPLFHQARPSDYPPETLDPASISFHKHWQIDPYQVYNKWFRKNDETWWHSQERRRRKSISLHDRQSILTEAESGSSKSLLHSKHISSDNDSARQEQHNRLPHGVVNVARSHPQHGKHNQPPPTLETSTSSTSAALTARMIANDYHHRYQSAHISNHFCENNELQSNSNLLLNHPPQQPVEHSPDRAAGTSFQEPNIIKHTEL
ncbi:beta-1,3-glucosyltransferase [Armigeres subalbatus]|uniref:beta-1,3-glucosyltransferase n=1 Tax=Armigeres subalbatus TaxID=124917 RepID=UPI002ED14304